MKLDILAIGVHPDDVELGCGGTVLKHVNDGYAVGILDLTQGELGTRGSVELRQQEAAAAKDILGVAIRENLSMKDGFFRNTEENQIKIIEVLRKYQPDVVLCNAVNDRHPDHARSAQLASDACFLSGLAKIETNVDGVNQAAWRPKNVYHYIQAYCLEPDFIVDISDFFDKKIESMLAYKSQFHNPDSNEADTFISSPEFLDLIKARAINFGTVAGVKHAEGFTTQRQVGVKDITKLF